MLNKRTNILFSEEEYLFLVALADKNKTSVGNLVRSAIKKTYLNQENLEEREKLVEDIFSLWPKQKTKKAIDYKQFIEDGRKN